MPVEEEVSADQPQQTQETAEPTGQPFADLPPESSDETAETQPAVTGETASEETEAAEAYQLPDEQLKVFPAEIYQEYAEKRYPNLAPILADPANPQREAVRQIIHDALNKDIFIQKLQAEEEPAEQTEEEEQLEEPTQPAVVDPAQAAAQVEASINSFVERVTDSVIAEKFYKDVNAAIALKDPKEQAVAFTKVMTRGMLNVLRDALPAFLAAPDGQRGWLDNQMERFISSNFEGFAETHNANARSSFWDTMRNSPEFKANNLPAFGSPEWLASLDKVAAIVPGFETAIFTDAQGKPLSPLRNWQEKAKVHARLLAGTATNATVVKASKAVETGKKLERESVQRKQNAHLGAGQSKGQIAPGPQSAIDQARKDSLARLRTDENPFATLNQVSK